MIDVHILPKSDDTRHGKQMIQNIPLQEGLRLPLTPRDCPNCGYTLYWHATKYAAGQQGLCTNCGYSLTVTDDVKRGG